MEQRYFDPNNPYGDSGRGGRMGRLFSRNGGNQQQYSQQPLSSQGYSRQSVPQQGYSQQGYQPSQYSYSQPPVPINMPQPYGANGATVINSPRNYSDVQLLIDHLKAGQQVIVDFSSVPQATVYRILDFMSGAVYALSGSIQQITQDIFLFAPKGVAIALPPQFGTR